MSSEPQFSFEALHNLLFIALISAFLYFLILCCALLFIMLFYYLYLFLSYMCSRVFFFHCTPIISPIKFPFLSQLPVIYSLPLVCLRQISSYTFKISFFSLQSSFPFTFHMRMFGSCSLDGTFYPTLQKAKSRLIQSIYSSVC